jgi:hypothetical protein
MRGFFIDVKIFLNTIGEKILLDREMREFNGPCLHC